MAALFSEFPRMAGLAICELTTYRWSFEEDVQHYAAAGMEGIGIWRQKLSDFGEQQGRKLLAEHPLKVSSLFWAGGFTGSGDQSHEEGIEDACDALRLAATLNAGCLIVHSGARAMHTQNHVRRLLLLALDKLLPLAEQLQVAVALEPMPAVAGVDWTFLNSLNAAAELAARYNTPALRLVLDTYYWGLDPELEARLPQIVPHLALVQLADSKSPPTREPNRCRLGEGQIPLTSILRALDQAGYRGNYEVELLGEEIETSNYGELLAHCENSFDGIRAAAAKVSQDARPEANRPAASS
jgi:sugar phosphate isomerase/epimerase